MHVCTRTPPTPLLNLGSPAWLQATPLKTPVPCKPVPMKTFDEAYERRRASTTEKFFTCRSGRTYCYFTDGAAPAEDGVAIVLCLHGLAQRSTDWLLKEPLEGIFQICVDRIGHGLSSGAPAAGFSFADGCSEMVEVVDAVYAAFNVPVEKKFFVAGHSMGATFAIELAACPDTRDRIEAIAPVSAPCDFWNPRVTPLDRKGLPFPTPILLKAARTGCMSGFYRWFVGFMAGFTVRASQKASQSKNYGQDHGFAQHHRGTIGLTDIVGDARWSEAQDADHFFLSKMYDGCKRSCPRKCPFASGSKKIALSANLPVNAGTLTDTDQHACARSCNSKHDAYVEFQRCYFSAWSYDQGEVKVPGVLHLASSMIPMHLCCMHVYEVCPL